MPWCGIEGFISIYFVISEILRFKVENLHKNCENLAMSQKQGYVGPLEYFFFIWSGKIVVQIDFKS